LDLNVSEAFVYMLMSVWKDQDALQGSQGPRHLCTRSHCWRTRAMACIDHVVMGQDCSHLGCTGEYCMPAI
jgi:hypothetical protein